MTRARMAQRQHVHHQWEVLIIRRIIAQWDDAARYNMTDASRQNYHSAGTNILHALIGFDGNRVVESYRLLNIEFRPVDPAGAGEYDALVEFTRQCRRLRHVHFAWERQQAILAHKRDTFSYT